QVTLGADVVGQGDVALGHALPDVVGLRGRLGRVVAEAGRVDAQDGGRLAIDLHASGVDGQDLLHTLDLADRRDGLVGQRPRRHGEVLDAAGLVEGGDVGVTPEVVGV